ncbi:helix-turn-helix domain-containing protein [Bacillus cereus]
MLHLKGYTNIKIAEIIGRSNLTIGTYVKRYQGTGIAGLELSYSPGAPRRLTPEQEERFDAKVFFIFSSTSTCAISRRENCYNTR